MNSKRLSRLASASVLAAPALVFTMHSAQIRAAEPAELAAATQWEELVKAAQREGKVEVNLGGQMPRKLRTAMPAFEKKYGIKVNFKTGGSRDHRARLFAERKMGRFNVDIWIGGANGALAELLPKKLLVPLPGLLVDPKVKDPALWYKGKHHYSDPEGRYIFTWGASPSYNVSFNTKLVKPEEIKSYADLLDPKWKGKIVSWSPARTGTAASSIPMYLNPKIGEKWFRRWINEMDVTFVRDARQGAEWVAGGRFAIGMFGMSTQAKSLEDQGFPIQAYLPHPMAEGQVLSASAANVFAIKDPPNPNARTLFLNWALGKEAQELFIKIGQTMDSLRRDVSNSAIAPQYRIDPKADYDVPFTNPEYISRQKEIMKKLRRMVKAGSRGKKKK